MRQYTQPSSWRLEGGGQVLDLETAVKDGILGGVCPGGLPSAKDAILDGREELDLNRMIEELDSAAAWPEDVPAVFICPISLEPMLDPVTLCTGQTYERANIQKWFALGRRTCPITMQELWVDVMTPNRTLHQLIHAWFAQHYLRMKKRSQDVDGRAAELVRSLKKAKGQNRVHALMELQKLVVTHSSVKKAVADAGGISLLSSLLGPLTSHAVGSEVIAILVNLILDSNAKCNLMQPATVSLVVDILNEGTIETKIDCTRLIKILIAESSFRPEMLSSLSLLAGLMRLVKDKRHPCGIAAGLSLLRAICSHKQVLSLIPSIGAVPQLVELLPDLTPDCLESALRILDDLSSIPEGCAALKDCPHTIPNAVRIVMMVSETCTQHALSILCSVCKLAPGDCGLLEMEVGFAAKLLLVMQSGCSRELKQQAAELLKLCSLNCSTKHFISKCKLTRTMQ